MLQLKLIGYLILAGAVFGISYQYNKKFLDWLRFQSLGTRDYIVDKLGMMFIDIPPQRILLGLFLLSFGLGTLVFLAFLPQLFPGIPFAILTAIIGWKIPKPIVDLIYQRRVKTFTLQMVDALGLMSNGLKSGLSIVQSLGLVTQEMPNPIQQEFNLILSQNKLGVPLEEAFTNLSKRVKSDDVEMFVTSVNILKETGGNLAETFDTIVTTIRDRIKVENKISAMTTQGFYQGIFVMAIPPLLGAFFYQSDPEFMRPLFTTGVGWAIVMVILLLEVVGFFVIMKVIKIDV
ncbi:MAG: type II secretion system F family protein [Oligoflexia bacterium]|nr:type II secretion system F family protein [Oligoflexia bacterium]